MYPVAVDTFKLKILCNSTIIMKRPVFSFANVLVSLLSNPILETEMRYTHQESLQEEADDTIQIRYWSPRHCRATHAIDGQNGNTQRRNAIAKKLKNSMVAFDILISGAPEAGRYLSEYE